MTDPPAARPSWWALAPGILVAALVATAAWFFWGEGEPSGAADARPEASARVAPPILADGITIVSDGKGTADPRYEPVDGNPAALITVTEADGRRGMLLFGLGDPGSAEAEQNLRLALADRRLPSTGAARAAVVFSHFHFNIFPPASAGHRPPPRDLFPAALRQLQGIALQGPNLARLCSLNRPSGHLMGSCSRRPRDAPAGITPLQWSDGPSKRVHLLTYAFSPPMDEERSRGISLTPQETVLIISTPPAGYLVFSYCSHMQAAPGGAPPVIHAAYLVKQAMAAGKLVAGPIHTLVTGTCDFGRTQTTRGGGKARSAGITATLRQMRADLGIRRLYLVHCGLTGEASAFQAPRAFPGAVIPLAPQ